MSAAPWTLSPYLYIEGRAHIDGLDCLAGGLEEKWGVDRLRLLVGNALRAKFDRQRLRLHEATQTGTLEELKTEVERMQLAWTVADREAEELGHKKLNPEVWEVALDDGTVAVVVKSNMDAAHVLADGRHKNVYTLDEIGRLILGFPALVKLKDTFPGATVTRTKPGRDPLEALEVYDDVIPSLY